MGSYVADSVGLQELGEKYVDWFPHVSSGQVVHLNLLFERARQQGADMDGLVADLRNICSRARRDDGIFPSPSSEGHWNDLFNDPVKLEDKLILGDGLKISMSDLAKRFGLVHIVDWPEPSRESKTHRELHSVRGLSASTHRF